MVSKRSKQPRTNEKDITGFFTFDENVNGKQMERISYSESSAPYTEGEREGKLCMLAERTPYIYTFYMLFIHRGILPLVTRACEDDVTRTC